MIKIFESNVFNTDADAIVNTINCVGFMGKGLAFEFSLRYPDLLDDYKDKCKNNEIKIGQMYYYKTCDKLIVNFPTKDDYKFPSKLEWIEQGLVNFVETYKNYNIKTIAFPLLGCSNGGLDFNKVIQLIKKYLEKLDIMVYICLDKNNPEGKELEMIKEFKKCDIELLSNFVRLNSVQKENLKYIQSSIKRFYQISKVDKIGSKTYREIYQIFYKNRIDTSIKQETLF